MKDLLKRGVKALTQVTGGARPPAATGSQEVQAFLAQVAAVPTVAGDARLVFALDATASRQATWDVATQLQAEMFLSTQALGGLQMQLCYFQGLAGFYSTSWQTDGDALLRQMTGIRCDAGMTQIERLLGHVIAENARRKLRGAVFIGDAMEENGERLCQMAGQLGLLQVPLFIFQEQDDPAARATFQRMAQLSGGAYARFDAASAHQLRDLLKAVAMYAAGGRQVLADFSRQADPVVARLTQQLK